MRDSSYGGPRRAIGDCGVSPDYAVYYDGGTASVPIFEAGVLKFPGGLSFDSGKGIGVNGLSINGLFSINRHDILPGGAGTKIRCCVASVKKKIRAKCCEPTCENNSERISVEMQVESTCENPTPSDEQWVEPVDVYFACGCIETCCQKLNKVAKLINLNPNSPAVATVVNVGTIWYLDLEAKIAGHDFRLVSSEGLTPFEVIVPNFKQTINAKSVNNWFPTPVIGACDADKCLKAVEIWFWEDRPYDEAVGAITSNPLTGSTHFRRVLSHLVVLFDPAVSQSGTTAYNALTTILTGTTEYNKVLLSTTCDDFVAYRFCITRLDAGNDAALTTVRADYTSQVISLTRTFYSAGRSYYTLTTKNSTPPTPVSTGDPAVADIVNPGPCGVDDFPCTVADGCPEAESTCIGC